jgi:hypothetical protein
MYFGKTFIFARGLDTFLENSRCFARRVAAATLLPKRRLQRRVANGFTRRGGELKPAFPRPLLRLERT